MVKTLGYLEGTNSEVLTDVIIEGHETIPLSNGWDNHGKNLTHITTADGIAFIVGYLHKFTTLFTHQTMEELFSAVRANKIPVLIIAPKDKHDKAHRLVAAAGIDYKFVDPADLADEVLKKLGPAE